MDDITALILDDHAAFRRGFARLDDAGRPGHGAATDLAAVWEPLALHLDIHAEAEERILYPHLLKRAGQGSDAGQGSAAVRREEAVEETDDAIRDHNKIRDAIEDARRHEVGSDEWWAAVWRARRENTEHLAEEEDEVLPAFRRVATLELRDELASQWLRFYGEHPSGRGLTFMDKDPKTYIKENT
jgi:hypothetical protein